MAKGAEMEVEVAEVVTHLRMTGEFCPALAQVVERKVTAEAARKAGVKVASGELQKAADGFRILHDLAKAADMNKWLKANGLTLEDFEEYLETSLLVSKLKDRLARRASKSKYIRSSAIQDTIRGMVYQEWMRTVLK